jgi:hypothetical protein
MNGFPFSTVKQRLVAEIFYRNARSTYRFHYLHYDFQEKDFFNLIASLVGAALAPATAL